MCQFKNCRAKTQRRKEVDQLKTPLTFQLIDFFAPLRLCAR